MLYKQKYYMNIKLVGEVVKADDERWRNAVVHWPCYTCNLAHQWWDYLKWPIVPDGLCLSKALWSFNTWTLLHHLSCPIPKTTYRHQWSVIKWASKSLTKEGGECCYPRNCRIGVKDFVSPFITSNYLLVWDFCRFPSLVVYAKKGALLELIWYWWL